MKTVRFLFNDEMSRAIVEGRKDVTRRPVNGVNGYGVAPCHFSSTGFASVDNGGTGWCICSREVTPPCAPGDLLIGRECWRYRWSHWNLSWPDGHREVGIVYRSDGAATDFYRVNEDGIPKQRSPRDGESAEDYNAYIYRFWKSYRPSIHMPDWAARIRRRIVSVTAERLQDITEDDAVREGFEPCTFGKEAGETARRNFAGGWNAIYAEKGLGWSANPWCWRIEFSKENFT